MLSNIYIIMLHLTKFPSEIRGKLDANDIVA